MKPTIRSQWFLCFHSVDKTRGQGSLQEGWGEMAEGERKDVRRKQQQEMGKVAVQMATGMAVLIPSKHR